MTEHGLANLKVDPERIGALCEDEWYAFLNDIEITPVPQVQDLRGFFLNWVAVFMPEAFPPILKERMSSWMTGFLREERDLNWSYVRPPLIGSALFALTGERNWLKLQIDNFADGGSTVRSFFHKSLALAAPQLTFDFELIFRLDHGMKVPYFFMEIPLALYIISPGDLDFKRKNFKRWQEGFLNHGEKEMVDAFLKGLPVHNPLLSWLVQGSNYAALRLGSIVESTSGNPAAMRHLAMSTVWERITPHPMFGAYIEAPQTETV
jgi:hypothetical protein